MRAGILLAGLFATFAAGAVKLDDSASPKRRIDVEPRWQYSSGQMLTPERLHAMVATMPNVEVRLGTASYVGKRARIYLLLPQFIAGLRSPAGLRVEWRARGAFQSGSALPGERALLYDGPITQATTSETFDFTLYIDSRAQSGPLRFDPTFDLDVVP